jgi:hypothetical protein
MDSNLQRLLYEVANSLQWGNDSDGNPPPFTFAEFTQSMLSAYNLAMYFLWHYERPAVKEQPARGTQAENWYTFLGGITPVGYSRKSTFKPFMAINKRRLFIK